MLRDRRRTCRFLTVTSSARGRRRLPCRTTRREACAATGAQSRSSCTPPRCTGTGRSPCGPALLARHLRQRWHRASSAPRRLRTECVGGSPPDLWENSSAPIAHALKLTIPVVCALELQRWLPLAGGRRDTGFNDSGSWQYYAEVELRPAHGLAAGDPAVGGTATRWCRPLWPGGSARPLQDYGAYVVDVRAPRAGTRWCSSATGTGDR